MKQNNNLEPISQFKNNITKIDTDDLKKINSKTSTIEQKNIIRSKLECQRLAKCNADSWKTFITLTIEKNITDIGLANKYFRNFIRSCSRAFKDFKYICVPEFQQRGAAHYHLFTNIPINSTIIPKRPLLRLWNKKTKTYRNLEYYNIKYWNYGFSEAVSIKNDIKKIIGYISKYMTKDIDNRLFNRHRYFYSRNLKKPIVSYLDLSNNKHLNYYINVLNNKNVIYENSYINSYDNQLIKFQEYM